MRRYLYPIIATILLGIGFYIGYLIFSPKSPVQAVDSQSIVNMLKQEGFLVTQAYIVNENARINNSSGNVVKDFLWRQEIIAFGTMKVNSGVDLQKLSDGDVITTNDAVNILLPPIEVQAVELLGDLTVQNKQGILKKIFDDEDGYNLAYQTLRNQALATAATSTILNEARNSTSIEIGRIIKLLLPEKNVNITFK